MGVSLLISYKINGLLYNNYCSLFPMEEDVQLDFDPIHTIQQFIKFTEYLLCHTAAENKPHPLVHHTTATHYELVGGRIILLFIVNRCASYMYLLSPWLGDTNLC